MTNRLLNQTKPRASQEEQEMETRVVQRFIDMVERQRQEGETFQQAAQRLMLETPRQAMIDEVLP